MNVYDALRELAEETRKFQHNIKCGGRITAVRKTELNDALNRAEEVLKTGGWHKWPNEKPEKSGLYLCLCGQTHHLMYYSKDRPALEAIYKMKWDYSKVNYWQPLPPIPEEKTK